MTLMQDSDVRTSTPEQNAESSAAERTVESGAWTRFRLAVVAFFLIAPPIFAVPAVGDLFSDVIGAAPKLDLSPPDTGQLDSLESGSRQTSTKTVTVTSERSKQIQSELQLLGATYILLEQYGDEEIVYRFICHVDRPSGGRRFESQHASSLDAMQQVLNEVRAWTGK